MPGETSWNIVQLEDWLARWLSEKPERRDCYPGMQQVLFDQEFRTETFLVRIGESDFGFAHTSLQKFFLADVGCPAFQSQLVSECPSN